jgi:hypothetical protein
MPDQSYQKKRKPKTRRVHQRARTPRKKTPNLVIGFSEEARRQLCRQAGLDPDQPLKYGSGIPTVAPEQLPDALDDETTITRLEHGVIQVDGPAMVRHETPKAWLEEALLADYFRQFCEALGVKPGPNQCRPDHRMLQALPRMVMMNSRLLQDVPPLLKGFYWVAEEYLTLRPAKIPRPESIETLAAQLKAISPTMTKTMAREMAAQIHGVKPESAITYRKRRNRKLRKKSGT